MTVTMGERHHADRIVQRGNRAGRAVVTKTYRDADAGEVHDAMLALWGSPLGAGRTPPGIPEPLGRDGATLTMSFVDGNALGVRGNSGSTSAKMPELARLLADLHGSGVTVRRIRSARKLLRSVNRKADRVSPALREPFLAALDAAAAAAPTDEDLVVSHGDFSPRNVLVNESGLVLIDFDRLQMAGRGRDVAYLGAWLWVTEMQDGAIPTWDDADAFLSCYAAAGGVTVDSLRDTASFHRSAALLRIAQSWSSLAGRPDQAMAVITEATRIAQMPGSEDVAP